jgi:hypothetical protein
VTNELVNVVTNHQFLFIMSFPVTVKFISAVILGNAVDLYSFLQSATEETNNPWDT